MPKITFITGKDQKTVEAKPDQTILQAAQENSVPMESACGGNGFCMTCKCRVRKGAESLSPVNEREEAMGISGEERLGCQATVKGDVMVEVESV
ncbi:MAG: 2Fe-2S iron-sulfur cluster-binding protein [Candidatus Peregrinibacteria bacterium]